MKSVPKLSIRTILNVAAFLVLSIALNSCKFYKQDLLFSTDGLPQYAIMKQGIEKAEANYTIRKGDWVTVRIYTNRGEMILDPNMELMRSIGGGGGNMMMMGGGMGGAMGGAMGGGAMGMGGGTTNQGRYLVDASGFCNVPIVGLAKLDGYTYRQADSVLQKKFAMFYEEPFVICRVANRRAFMFTAMSGIPSASVVPLENENMSLVEVIAQAGGLGLYSKAKSVRLIRGDLKDPKVMVVDLSTIEGLRSMDLTVQPYDIIYIEPGRRPFLDAFRDYASLVSLPFSIISLILVISTR